MAKVIFVDTWAWVALADRHDMWHESARACRAELRDSGARFVTTNVVIYETHSLARSRCSHEVAVALVDDIRVMAATPGILEIRWVQPAVEEAALEILRRYDDKDFSFVDCLSFAVMREMGIEVAFTGDEHFRQMGFETLPEIE